jgi:hypothetical protein
MSRRVDFENNISTITEDWLDDIQELLSRHIDGIYLERVSNNQVRAQIDTQGSIVTDPAVGSTAHKWRYVTTAPVTTVTGSTGSKAIYAVGGPDSNTANPATNANKAFSLEVLSGTPSTPNYRQLGTCDWSGTVVSNIRFTAGQQPPADLKNAFTITPIDSGGVPLGIRGVLGQTADLFRIGSSDSTSDRFVVTSAGQVRAPATGSTGGLVIGGDTNLYRSAADTLRTDDSLVVNLNLSVNGNAAFGASGSSLGFYGAAPVTRSAAYTVTSVTTDRTISASSTTLDELVNVVGTLITDLKTMGLIG